MLTFKLLAALAMCGQSYLASAHVLPRQAVNNSSGLPSGYTVGFTSVRRLFPSPSPSHHLSHSNQSLTHAPPNSKIQNPSDKVRSAPLPAPPHPSSKPPPPPSARAPTPPPSTPRSVADPAIAPLAAPATTSSMPACRIATRTPMIRVAVRRRGQRFREVRVISR